MASVERHPRNTMSMDCCLCNRPVASSFMPPRNTICCFCYRGGKEMITFLNETHDSKSTDTNFKVMYHGLDRMKEMQKKVSFLDAVAALREGILTDILVKPANGPPIPAHRALLAAKSGILRTMLMSDDCKAAAQDSISFPELSHAEVKCLLEFLYSGSLPEPLDNDSSLYYALLIASDKYDIPFLREECRNRIVMALQPSNALDALKVSQVCSDAELKEEAICTIVHYAEEVIFSAGYEEFASRNARLSVDITQAVLKRIKRAN